MRWLFRSTRFRCWRVWHIYTNAALSIGISSQKVSLLCILHPNHCLPTALDILLDHDGVIKFVDFGAAKVIARQGNTRAATRGGGRQNSMTGTPMYMSPEVIKGQTNGRLGAADMWSLGCVVLEMATGRRPWASLDNEWAIMFNIANANMPQLPTSEQLSEEGIDFLNKCFDRDPSKRASAAELLQHDWIMFLRNRLSLEPQTPSDTSSSGGSLSAGSRQNSMNWT